MAKTQWSLARERRLKEFQEIEMAIQTSDEIMKLLKDKSESTQVDSWRIKVNRRNQQGSLPVHVATFEDAQLVHVANAEQWLTQLAGGGPYYQLEVYHQSEPLIPLGRINLTIEGEVRKADPLSAQSPNWRGPRRCIFPPLPSQSQEQQQGPIFMSPPTSPQVGGPHTQPALGGSGTGAPSFSVTQQSPEDSRVSAALERLAARERELDERRHKQDLEATERRSNERIRLLEEKLSIQAPPSRSALADLAPLLAPLATILQEMVKASNETRQLMLKMEADSRAQQMTMQKDISEANRRTMELMLNRPTDPFVQSLLEKMEKMVEAGRTRNAPEGEIVSQKAEAFGRMTKTTLSLVHAAAEMRAGEGAPADHPMMAVMKEATKAVQAISDGYKASVLSQSARPVAPLPAAAVTSSEIVPVQVAPPTQPAPTPASPTSLGTVDKLEVRIRNKESVADVAREFVDALGTPDMERELQQSNGDPAVLFQRRLGEAWLAENPTNGLYAQQLLAEINTEAERKGIFQSEGEEEAA